MVKRKFFIQWDSTNNCNLRCFHCYHNLEGEDHANHIQEQHSLMTFDEVRSMIDDLNSTAHKWDFKPKFQISGGEPLMREDLLDILNYTNSLNLETILLTNGTLITSKKAEELYKKNVKRLQISLDGSRNTHNKIRGRSYAYDRAIEGIRNSANAGILVNVSMTVLQSNKNELEDVIISSKDAGAKIVGFQSYVPTGHSDTEFIGAKDTYNLYQNIRKLRKKYNGQIKVLETEVLWQIMQWDTKIKKYARASGKFLSGCGAGFSGVAVLSNGTVYPCRRLPIPLGHIKEGITNIMLKNPILQDLRDLKKMKEITGCKDINYCRGCRAIAYAMTGDYMAKDPMCFRQYVKPEDIEPRVIRR